VGHGGATRKSPHGARWLTLNLRCSRSITAHPWHWPGYERRSCSKIISSNMDCITISPWVISMFHGKPLRVGGPPLLRVPIQIEQGKKHKVTHSLKIKPEPLVQSWMRYPLSHHYLSKIESDLGLIAYTHIHVEGCKQLWQAWSGEFHATPWSWQLQFCTFFASILSILDLK